MTAATASRLIDQARADGLELVPNGDKLKLRGPAEVVERWKPRLAENKAEVMAALTRPIPDDLAALIETAAQFYQYSGDDLASINDLARRDHEGLRAALLADPLRPYMAGMKRLKVLPRHIPYGYEAARSISSQRIILKGVPLWIAPSDRRKMKSPNTSTSQPAASANSPRNGASTAAKSR